jgi:hypothetical protein
MACLAAMAGSQAHAAPLTIDQIIMLTQTGIGDEAVIAKIRNTDTHMDLSVDQMLELKKKGVSSPVLAALLDTGAHAPATPQFSLTSADPAVPHPAGVYILDSAHAQMTRIDPTATSQSKTGGIFGYALTGVSPRPASRPRSRTPRPASIRPIPAPRSISSSTIQPPGRGGLVFLGLGHGGCRHLSQRVLAREADRQERAP